jgi:L-fucose/D-arabinose isomerase
MKGKTHLSIGYTSIWIAWSTVNPDFFQNYLGMRTDFVDKTEVLRRIEQEIYSKEQLEKALAWVKEKCTVGADANKNPSDRKRKDREWETVVKWLLSPVT